MPSFSLFPLQRARYSVLLTTSTPGDVILYDAHLAVYKHSLDLILYIIAGPAENELMLWSALQSLSDSLSLLLRNQLEKRGVMENLDLVVLCLDETIDDGYAPWSVRNVSLLMRVSVRQNYRRHRLDGDRIEGEPAKNRDDGHCDQRTDAHECIQHGEGKGTATDGPVLDANDRRETKGVDKVH